MTQFSMHPVESLTCQKTPLPSHLILNRTWHINAPNVVIFPATKKTSPSPKNHLLSPLYSAERMEPQSPPSKIARLSDSGFGSSTSMEDGSIGLGLELGNGNGGGHIHHNRQYRPSQGGFTFLQMQELEHQSIIYKHIEAGLPVPHHLLLPIWKCVATSLGGAAGGCGPFSHYYCSPLYMEYKKSMDPEPERCRRTDGKKWRCSKQVVEDHKYCERHMNRGRHRSRKRVEPPPPPAHHLLSTTTISSSTNRDSNTNLSISLPIDISPKECF